MILIKRLFIVIFIFITGCSSQVGYTLIENEQCRGETDIDVKSAVEIARENGLSEGIKDWTVELKPVEKFSDCVWEIRSFKYESRGSHGYTGNGEQMIIDPVTGEVLEKKEWFVR
jgi:hypothetical protein